MRADGETMRLVAQALHEIKRRIARGQLEGFAALDEKRLAPGVAVRALGDGGDRHAGHAKLRDNRQRGVELPPSAVDQHQIGFSRKGLGVRLGRLPLLLEHAGKAARQNFAHHGVIVAGGRIDLDVEGAVMGFHETLRSRDDHRADRRTPHDVRIVINFYAARRSFHAEGGAERLQQFLLAGAVGETAAQRLARVFIGVDDKFAFFRRAGASRSRPCGRLFPKARRQQVRFLDLMRQQDEFRRRPIGIELREERRQHLARRKAAVGARKIGAIAPVLAGAIKHRLDAELPRLLVNGEDIGLGHRCGLIPCWP